MKKRRKASKRENGLQHREEEISASERRNQSISTAAISYTLGIEEMHPHNEMKYLWKLTSHQIEENEIKLRNESESLRKPAPKIKKEAKMINNQSEAAYIIRRNNRRKKAKNNQWNEIENQKSKYNQKMRKEAASISASEMKYEILEMTKKIIGYTFTKSKKYQPASSAS